MSKSSIKLNQVLAEMDMSLHTDGSQHSFSIRFIMRNGETVFLFRAVKTGLNMNLKKNAMRGVRPVDIHLNPIGHIYPVSIWSIVAFNGEKIVL
ncbi:MAG: hypothetical protein ACOYOV_12115 [Bacteroidales bacterium]